MKRLTEVDRYWAEDEFWYDFETGRYEPTRRYCPECGALMDGKNESLEG